MPKFETTKLWDKDWYSVDALKQMLRESPAEIRKEYQRLKRVADKRLDRLEKEHDWTKTYKNKEEGFKNLSDLDIRDLPKEMHELYQFLSSGASTISGQRARQKKTMESINRAIGAYDEDGNLIPYHARVTKRNYRRVIEILDEARRRKLVYGSDKIVELADLSLEMSQVDFDDILENLETLLPNTSQLMDIPELEGYSFEEVIKKVGR